MKNIYLRIGTSYFKKSLYPLSSGDFVEVLVGWSPELIRQDHGKNVLSEIEKYDGFICIPENRPEFFKKRIQDYYNTYHQISRTPTEGSVTITLKFLSHIFGEQIQLGIDYLQLLYLKPAQILPILCLVSKERSTGKSTFLKWLKEIFEYNLTFLTNNDFISNFNSDWSSKLLICIDEVLFKTEELTERIKYLSTTNTHKTEAKGKDKKEATFFGKFILASNNETSFIKIDPDEIRFWVLKINKFQEEDVHILNKLISEIPAFLHFLIHRKLSTENKSRMWFTPQQINTKALQKLVKFNSSIIENEVANILLNTMESLDVEILEFCFSDLLNILNKFRLKYDAGEIKKIVRDIWKLEQAKNSNQYQKITVTTDLDFYQNQSKGRHYSVSSIFLAEKVMN
ncbi:primase-helicase family protein [Flavobacterium sp.]|uniref:primase-helicase family protein n=1 Tax=Flavobacterium sp. TaxID=239 RepID=UPI002B596F54|nr:primase-helicase family protein [Flavobacterium sp.]HSD07672.1 primase-helicase family protein [Flavobacterium sp.]